MAQSKNRLGRGLGGLISGGSVAQAKQSKDSTTSETKTKTQSNLSSAKGKSVSTSQSAGLGYQEIMIGKIKANPYQPRREIAGKQVKELAMSIQSEGLLQPIVVRAAGKSYELIVGERRLKAFKFLKSKKIPCRRLKLAMPHRPLWL